MRKWKAIKQLEKDENLDIDKLRKVIDSYLFTDKEPMRDDIIGMINKKPALKDRSAIAKRLTNKIMSFIETFINGVREK